jgi:hypothetical protein
MLTIAASAAIAEPPYFTKLSILSFILIPFVFWGVAVAHFLQASAEPAELVFLE